MQLAAKPLDLRTDFPPSRYDGSDYPRHHLPRLQGAKVSLVRIDPRNLLGNEVD
jgi:hypothetical protein